MARNRLAGKSGMRSKSARYYATNPKANAKHIKDNTEINRTPRKKRIRKELAKYNRTRGTEGDGKDASHKNGVIVGLESEASNRARNGKGSVKVKKKVIKKKGK